MALAGSTARRRVLAALTARLDALGTRYRMSQKGEVMFRCPAHDDRHASFSFNVKKGLGHCFACGWSPNTAALARRLHFDAPDAQIEEAVEKPTEQRRWRIPPLTERGRRYLAGRGIQGPVVEKARLGECESGLAIPWISKGGEILFPTVRTWSGEPKYVSPPGTSKGKQLYGWHMGIGRQAVIVEGELDAVYLHQFGFPALALGTSHITDDQAAEVRGMTTFILLDGDRAGDIGSEQVYSALRGECEVRTLSPPRPVDPSDLTEEELALLLRDVDRVQVTM